MQKIARARIEKEVYGGFYVEKVPPQYYVPAQKRERAPNNRQTKEEATEIITTMHTNSHNQHTVHSITT